MTLRFTFCIAGVLLLGMTVFPQKEYTQEELLSLPVFDSTVPECSDKKVRIDFPIKQSKPAPKPRRPRRLRNGSYPIIRKYINDNYNDPYSVKYISWSTPVYVKVGNSGFWKVTLKHRAKNSFGAYILREDNFYVNGKLVVSEDVFKSLRLASSYTDTSPSVPFVSGDKPNDTAKAVVSIVGESLSDLAYRCQVKLTEVARINNLAITHEFETRRYIRLPAGYTPFLSKVKGDYVMIVGVISIFSRESAARRYNNSTTEISTLNPGVAEFRKGMKLKILIRKQ